MKQHIRKMVLVAALMLSLVGGSDVSSQAILLWRNRSFDAQWSLPWAMS